jgi:hypothetical protein
MFTQWTGGGRGEILPAISVGGAAMPVTVKSISLWRKEAENKTGFLAHTLSRLQRPEQISAL